MGRVLKYLIYLIVLAGMALAGYAALFDLPAPEREVIVPLNPALSE